MTLSSTTLSTGFIPPFLPRMTVERDARRIGTTRQRVASSTRSRCCFVHRSMSYSACRQSLHNVADVNDSKSIRTPTLPAPSEKRRHCAVAEDRDAGLRSSRRKKQQVDVGVSANQKFDASCLLPPQLSGRYKSFLRVSPSLFRVFLQAKCSHDTNTLRRLPIDISFLKHSIHFPLPFKNTLLLAHDRKLSKNSTLTNDIAIRPTGIHPPNHRSQRLSAHIGQEISARRR